MSELTLKLQLRLAKPDDFKLNDLYLYGTPYWIKTGGGWQLLYLRRTKASARFFSEYFQAGIVYVAENIDALGVVDAV